MRSYRFRLPAALVMLVALAAGAAELPGGGQQQEYFVRQNAGESLLVRVDGREARFESSVFTIDGERLISSQVPGSRLAPLFQYVPAADEDRQLDIRITAPLDTDRTRFDLGFSRFTVRDDRTAELAQAYRWLSFGLELPETDTEAGWSIKVNALLNASRTFRSFGMEPFELWSRYYLAQLTFLELGDNGLALQLVNELLAHPGARRQDGVRLAALRLRAEALEALRAAGELPAEASEADPVQQAAQAVVREAGAQDQRYERAEANALAGRDLASRQRFAEALERFEAALEEAEAIAAGDLATRVRESMVEIYGNRGDVAASSEVLQAIESQLAEEGANDELAQNLLAQGRILVRTYRYPEARRVLRQALEFEHNSATRNQLRLVLAEAAWAMGDLGEARAQAEAAVRDPGGGYRRPTPVLDVAAGLNILAGVHRARDERGELRTVREAQRRVLARPRERVLWSWERAQDELVAPPYRADAALPWLRRVRSDAAGVGLAPLGSLAQLWLCRLGVDCPAGAADRAYRFLRATAIPRHRVAAGWLLAGIQARNGRARAAATSFETLLEDMTFYRYALPGVLGDTYWRRIEAIGAEARATFRTLGDAERQLLGLARLRWLRASGAPWGLPFDRGASGLDTDAFRARLARRERPETGDDPEALGRDLERDLTAGQARFEASMDFLSPAGLERWLRALAPGEAVLDWDVDGERVAALLGNRGRVVRVDLGRAGAALAEARRDPRSPAALTAARRLLEPLAGRLPPRLYLAAGGALAFLPFEAVSPDGMLPPVRLAAFPAVPGPGARLAPTAPDRVFLAGRPVDFTSGYLARLDTGAELGAVMDRFVGPGLVVIQGSALLEDEFRTPAFREAGLVHLAVPALLDLRRPENAWLELSEERGGAGRQRLGPAEVASWALTADLLVLSQSRIEPGDSPRAARPPIVAQALAAGARAALVTTVPGEDADAGRFLGAFYDALAQGADLPGALQAARSSLPVGAPRDRYQLWVP